MLTKEKQIGKLYEAYKEFHAPHDHDAAQHQLFFQQAEKLWLRLYENSDFSKKPDEEAVCKFDIVAAEDVIDKFFELAKQFFPENSIEEFQTPRKILRYELRLAEIEKTNPVLALFAHTLACIDEKGLLWKNIYRAHPRPYLALDTKQNLIPPTPQKRVVGGH